MMSQFVAKVKYTKQLENGTFKRVAEPYLVFGYTFTDAEANIYEELGSIIRGEFIVSSLTRADFHDIFLEEGFDLLFKCKITYVSQDADSEKAKRISQNFLVSATNVDDAYKRLRECLTELMVNFTITSVVTSPIIDVFLPQDKSLKDKEISRKPLETVTAGDFEKTLAEDFGDDVLEVEFEDDSDDDNEA